MTDPVEIMNRFTEYAPWKGEEPLPLPIPGHWFRKICALAERIARAENELEAMRERLSDAEEVLRTIANSEDAYNGGEWMKEAQYYFERRKAG